MDEHNRPIKKRLNEQLPTHSPDPGTWQNLVSRLDAMDADAAFHQKLDQLPVHSPNPGTWSLINRRLNRAVYFKTATRIALSAAAGLLLFLTVSRITDQYRQPSTNPVIALQEQPGKLHTVTNQPETLTSKVINPGRSAVNKVGSSIVKSPIISSGVKEDLPPAETPASTSLPENNIALKTEIPLPAENGNDQLTHGIVNQEEPIAANLLSNPDSESKVSVLFQDQQKTDALPPVKYYFPNEPKTGSNKNYFALSMSYLPENIDNGSGTSLFHNVDLTASYNKEKVRYNTSIGMTYNEEELAFNMNYDIKTPVTATGPGGHIDTVSYAVAMVESQYQGTEQHQYITYNLGLGRRIFQAGKFSTWFTAGAGFGVQINNPDLIAETEKSVKGQYNAKITSVNSDQPVYNDVNINFVTGLDINYKFLKRLSISFAPVSRWYFKPVLTKNNQATDELTLGFKTGMKFDF